MIGRRTIPGRQWINCIHIKIRVTDGGAVCVLNVHLAEGGERTVHWSIEISRIGYVARSETERLRAPCHPSWLINRRAGFVIAQYHPELEASGIGPILGSIASVGEESD